MTRRLGLIVNPVAGLGGRVGLKGSDGIDVQQRARALGATPEAENRAGQALALLRTLLERQPPPDFELLTAPGEMGESAARRAGFAPVVVGEIPPATTTAEDTCRSAQQMQTLGVELLLFAGGDGTARDVHRAVGLDTPVLGIPAGVKIHSAVFAVHPHAAGELAATWLAAGTLHLQEAEVVDLDEESYRAGRVITRLHGYLRVPRQPRLVQNQKAPSPAAADVQAAAIAAAVIASVPPGWNLVLGPGTTTRAVAAHLGVPKTLVGVDVVARDGTAKLDVGEARLLELVAAWPAQIVVSPIGGQGFLFGRGNQQISPAVLRRVGKENLLVVAAPEKLAALHGQPLLVDTGDPAVDEWLAGYVPVITGYQERTFYRIAGAS
jgi:predicted polyphosphate/ATP-dependent NAD kinase